MSTLDASPKGVLEAYHSRDAVERGFRITKETIRIRPTWNRTEQNIKAHLFICFLAYLLISLVDLEGRKQISGGHRREGAGYAEEVHEERFEDGVLTDEGGRSSVRWQVLLEIVIEQPASRCRAGMLECVTGKPFRTCSLAAIHRLSMR